MKPCPNVDELQLCPDCKEWTGICVQCCDAGVECDLCDGSGEIED